MSQPLQPQPKEIPPPPLPERRIPLSTVRFKGGEDFGSEARPLRPSKLHNLLACSMSAFLTLDQDDDRSKGAADTGSLVHSAAAAFHKTPLDMPYQGRKEAGDAALEAARDLFPQGDPKKAAIIFSAYSADPENQRAVVPFIEKQIRLDLPPWPDDPTGLPIVIVGTLDQIRLDPLTGKMYVWDIKTGMRLQGPALLAEHMPQQAAYVLGARQTLDPEILPGGLIYTPGYEKPRGRRFITLGLTIEQLKLILVPLVRRVSLIRQGVPDFTPSPGACEWCSVGPLKNCLNLFYGAYAYEPRV